MKRKVLFYSFLLLFCCFFAMPAVEAKAADYLITGYDVDMKVTKQNTYRIKETITTKFLAQRHGIYRDIPVVNDVRRTDGSTDRILAKVENISCGVDRYEVSRQGDYCRIQIGDEDKTVVGKKVYTISYDYVMGNDVLPEEDELYFNIIGNGWQNSIRNVTFRIEMPAEFEEEKLGMSYGPEGSTETSGLYYYVEGNTIYGELDSEILLSSYEGVNVRLSLPEGYFERTEKTPYPAYLAIVLALLTMGLAFLLWWLFGRDDPVVETVEFYPPDGLNSVELAFIYNGNSSRDDVISLIVYLAQKGYIEIQEGEGKSGKDFTLIRRRPYDGVNEMEEIFMNGLFAKGEKVTKKDLENTFYKTVDRITGKMGSKKNKEKIFYANSLNKGWILWLLPLITCVLAGFLPVKNYEYSLSQGLVVSFAVGLMPMLASRTFFSHGNIVGRILFGFIFLLMGLAGYFIFLRTPLQYENIWYTIAFLAAAVAGFVAMFFNCYLSKRTPYGTEMLGRIRGFKTFLETAEKERLEALVMENPQYFYEILPYTYVLGISDKWMKKFESITVEPPTWYAGGHSSAFDMIMFHHFMNTTMSAATSSMTSTPSSSSSSGGGFSGGGSGGGGGGSW